MRLFLVLLSFTVLQAQAKAYPVIEKRQGGDTPIREARAVIKLNKLTYSAADEAFNIEEICAVDTVVPVYDARESNTIQIDPDTYYKLHCPTTVGGEAAEVLVGGLMALVIAGDSTSPEEMKFVNMGLWVDPDGPVNNTLAADQNFSVDVSNHRVESFLEPRVEYTCEPGQDDELHCSVDKPEFFSAQIELYDTP